MDKKTQHPYDEQTIKTVGELAQAGFAPSVIASNMGFEGIDRSNFLRDIVDVKHPLGQEYIRNRKISETDIETALNYLQLQGNTDAMHIALLRERRNYISLIKKDLFGL